MKVVSLSWLLWITLSWMWECRYLFEILVSFPLDLYPEVVMGGYMIVVLLIFWGTSYVFYNNLTNLHLDNIQRFLFFFPHILACIFYLFDSRCPNMWRWHLIMVLFAFPWWLVVLSVSIQRKKGKFEEEIEIFWMVQVWILI